MLRILHFAAWVGTSIAVAELLGYVLHRLLHSGWIPWLSMSHMKHHMVLYGPLQNQRPSEEYLDATTGSVALGNAGLEWIVPSTMILTTVVVVLLAPQGLLIRSDSVYRDYLGVDLPHVQLSS